MNEPLPWELDQTIAFFAEITPELHARGLKVAGPSWSVGNPELDALRKWGYFGDRARIDLLTFHAYWAEKGFTAWAALRPLRLMREAGFTGDWAITEGGRDNLSTPAFGEGGNGGWQRDGVSAEQYVRELLEFTALNAAHPGFRGFTPFTAAPTDPRWFPYSTDGLVDLILAGQPAGGNGGAIVFNDPAGLIKKYNLAVIETQTLTIALEEAPPGQVELRADGPPDLRIAIRTADGRNRVEGMGHAAVVMAMSSDYYPEQGQRGPWVIEAEGASVVGAGMRPDHSHANVRFVRKIAPQPPTDPPQPPSPDREIINGFAVSFGFLAAYKADKAGLGLPISPMLSSGQFGGEPDVPAGRQRQVQYFKNATLYYDGFNVKRL